MPDLPHLVEVLERYDAIQYDKSPWPRLGSDEQAFLLDWDRLYPAKADAASEWDAWQPEEGLLGLEQLPTVAPDLFTPEEEEIQLRPGRDEAMAGGALNADLCAWYQPAHYFGPDMGIYIRQECVLRLARRLVKYLVPEAWALGPWQLQLRLIRAAVMLYFLHEQYHHKTECLAVRALILLRHDVYHQYMDGVYAPNRGTDALLEESLAHADMYLRLSEPTYATDLGRPIVRSVRRFLKAISPYEPPGYRRASSYLDAASFAMGENLLQGQMREGRVRPQQPIDEWNRAPRLLQSMFDIRSQVWVVLPPGKRVILPSRVIPATCSTKEMVRLCTTAGYREVKGGGKGSHLKLAKPGARTIVLPGDRRELSPGVANQVLKILGPHRLADLPRLLAGELPLGGMA